MIFFPNLVLFLWNLHGCASHFSQKLGVVFDILLSLTPDIQLIMGPCRCDLPNVFQIYPPRHLYALSSPCSRSLDPKLLPLTPLWSSYFHPSFSAFNSPQSSQSDLSVEYRSDRSLPYLCPSVASRGSRDKSQILGLVYKAVHGLAPTYLSRSTCSSPDTSTFLGSSQALCLAPTTGILHAQLPLPEVLFSLCFTVTTSGAPLWHPDQVSCPVTCSHKDQVSPFQSPYHS